jgi:hypothetical protein
LTRGWLAKLAGVNQHRHHHGRRHILILIVAQPKYLQRNALRCRLFPAMDALRHATMITVIKRDNKKPLPNSTVTRYTAILND